MAFRKRDAALISHIDVTALAAVLFVLAIVMMEYRTPPPHTGTRGYLYVDLPKVSAAKLLPGLHREDSIIVSITRDSQVFLDYERVRLSDLHPRLLNAKLAGSEHRVYLYVDARARYLMVMNVLDQIRYAGIRDVSFVAEVPDEFLRHR